MKNRIGCRVLDCPRPDAALIEGFRGLPSSNIGDQMERPYNTNSSLKSLNHIPLRGPAFAVKVPQGPYKNGPGEINAPVCCGGRVICPGDILVGDRDGIVVIPPEFAAEILPKAKEKFESEQRTITSGKGGNRAWVDRLIEAL